MDFYYILIALGLMIVIAALLGLRDKSAYRKRLIRSLTENYGKKPVRTLSSEKREHIKGYYNNHRSEDQIDDITWNDLDMDSVYDRMNYCLSAAGEEYLYYLLRTPYGTSDTEKLEKEVSCLKEDHELRRKLQLIFSDIGNNSKYSIYDYIKYLENIGKADNAKHFLMLFLLAASAVLSFFYFSIGFILFLAIMCLNIISYFRIKSTIDPYLTTYGYIMRVIKSVDSFSSVNSEVFADTIKELKEISAEFAGFKAGSSILMAPARMNSGGNPADLFMDYIRMVTHIDIIKFNQMYKEIMSKKDRLDRILELTGRLESEISIACFRASFEGKYCIPSFEGDEYKAKDLIHPLIENPVSNDIETDSGKGILITGSNASGKSTFLKTCAINSILAQTVNTVLGSSYKAPRFRIFTSMALKDDLFEGESYYIVEIKSIKRILDCAVNKDDRILCFIDEVLRGTNTVERIAASTQILGKFMESGVLCFAATHDIELTELLSESFDQYHFEGNVSDNDVFFDYIIKKGPAINRNAIKLLGVLGYDESMTKNAEIMAENFLKTGVWK